MSVYWVDELEKKHNEFLKEESEKKEAERIRAMKKAAERSIRVNNEVREIVGEFFPKLFKEACEIHPEMDSHLISFDRYRCLYRPPYSTERKEAPFLFDSFVEAAKIINSVDSRMTGRHIVDGESDYVSFKLEFNRKDDV